MLEWWLWLSSLFQVSAQTSIFETGDLYLEGRTSGNFPFDDEDGEDDGSGSGSGDYGKRTYFCFETFMLFLFF